MEGIARVLWEFLYPEWIVDWKEIYRLPKMFRNVEICLKGENSATPARIFQVIFSPVLAREKLKHAHLIESYVVYFKGDWTSMNLSRLNLPTSANVQIFCLKEEISLYIDSVNAIIYEVCIFLMLYFIHFTKSDIQ